MVHLITFQVLLPPLPKLQASYGLLTFFILFYFKETSYLVWPLTGIMEFAISLQ